MKQVYKVLLSIGLFSSNALAEKQAKPSTIGSKPLASPINATKRKPVGLVAQFAEAQKLYQQAKYAEALLELDRLYRKYPDHDGTILYYGRTLYKLDRIQESYNLLGRLDVKNLDPDVAYEYGFGAYSNQRFEQAIVGFKRIPDEHSLYDLANFYGAVSAIKLRRYTEAELMLEKAVVLPDKLSKNRNLYLKHVRSLRQFQEKSALEAERQQEKARIKNQTLVQTAKPGTATPLPASPDTKTPTSIDVHKGFFALDRLVDVKVQNEHQEIDKHGYNQSIYDNNVASLDFLHGPYLGLAKLPSYDGGFSGVGLQLRLKVEDKNSKGRQERIVVYEDSVDVPRSLADELPSIHETTAIGSFEPWIEFALPHKFWIGASALLQFDYPRFEKGLRTSKRGGSSHIGLFYDAFRATSSARLKLNYEQLADAKLEPLIDTLNPELTNELKFVTDTSWKVDVGAQLNKYHLISMSGPDDILYVKTSVKQKFPLGFNLEGKLASSSIRNNVVRGLPQFEFIDASGESFAWGAALDAVPLPWLKLGAEYNAQKTDWKVDDPAKEDVFVRNVADYVASTKFFVSIQFLF